jgi:hypothetical protein
MKTFKTHITERFLNAIKNHDDELEIKEKYADQVWSILQDSYRAIGGIRGSGFNDKQDMIDNIPFWKLYVRNDLVKAVVMYKDKNGRKSVAVGTDGSDDAKAVIYKIMKEELSRSYGEKSKASLAVTLKSYPWVIIKHYLHTPNEAQAVLSDDVLTPLKSIKKSDWPEDAKKMIDKYPGLVDYGYIREIGGKPTFKVLIGTTKRSIK